MIELILVMAILTIALSLTAPALANFFRGRSLDSEARRVLALTRYGQARAVSEAIPMDLWIDTAQGKFGLEAEPSYESEDAKSQELALAGDMKLEAVFGGNTDLGGGQTSLRATRPGTATMAAAQTLAGHPNLPRIRFLPDGTVSESSPSRLRLAGQDGMELWLAQTTNRLSYEIRNRLN